MLELSAPCYYLQILFHDCLRKFRILCEHRDEATMRSEFIVPIPRRLLNCIQIKGKTTSSITEMSFSMTISYFKSS